MHNRIAVLDVLRGVALMGLFIVHMVEYFELYWYRPEPGWVHNVVFFIFGGKAYGLFALLFGVSFTILMDNNRRRGVNFRQRFVWRMAILWFFGYLHSLLYVGDILQLLALGGVVLACCYRTSNRFIAIIATVLLLQAPTWIISAGLMVNPSIHYGEPVFPSYMMSNFQVFAHGNFTELIAHNSFAGQKAKWAFFIETGRIWNILGLMFLGVLAGRTGLFRQSISNRNLALWGIGSLAAYLAVKLLMAALLPLVGEGMPRWFALQAFTYCTNLTLISLGMGLLIAVYQRLADGRIVQWFAAAGRLTLTWYVLQSVIFVPLFYGFGLGRYETLGQFNGLLLGLLFWLCQLWASQWYINRYRYGPLEKLWRQATLINQRI